MILLRAASYNIHHGADARDRLDLGRTAETLAALDADVIGLQEVDVHYGARSGGVDQAARMGEMLGMQVSFGAAIDRADPRVDRGTVTATPCCTAARSRSPRCTCSRATRPCRRCTSRAGC